MIFLFISIFASSAIGIVMRISQVHIKGKTVMLASNYVTCIICAWLYLGDSGITPASSGLGITLTLGIINGAIYLSTLLLQDYSIKKSGVVLPSVFARIGSLIVPLFISIVFYRERPELLQIFGAVLAIVAIFAINGENSDGKLIMLPLCALLLADGMASSMSKVFEQTGYTELSSHFLFYTFVAALVFCTVLVIYRKERLGLKEVLYGILIGIPNYFASRFLLLALSSIPAVIAYPIRSVGSIFVLALAGIFLFHEKLSKRQWRAIAAILIAVIMLSI